MGQFCAHVRGPGLLEALSQPLQADEVLAVELMEEGGVPTIQALDILDVKHSHCLSTETDKSKRCLKRLLSGLGEIHRAQDIREDMCRFSSVCLWKLT